MKVQLAFQISIQNDPSDTCKYFFFCFRPCQFRLSQLPLIVLSRSVKLKALLFLINVFSDTAKIDLKPPTCRVEMKSMQLPFVPRDVYCRFGACSHGENISWLCQSIQLCSQASKGSVSAKRRQEVQSVASKLPSGAC